jgi:hypothetical protein
VSEPTQHYQVTKAALCLNQRSIIIAPKRHCVCTNEVLSGNQSGIVSEPKQHYHVTKAALCLRTKAALS